MLARRRSFQRVGLIGFQIEMFALNAALQPLERCSARPPVPFLRFMQWRSRPIVASLGSAIGALALRSGLRGVMAAIPAAPVMIVGRGGAMNAHRNRHG